MTQMQHWSDGQKRSISLNEALAELYNNEPLSIAYALKRLRRINPAHHGGITHFPSEIDTIDGHRILSGLIDNGYNPNRLLIDLSGRHRTPEKHQFLKKGKENGKQNHPYQ
jgi:hypothetical protein